MKTTHHDKNSNNLSLISESLSKIVTTKDKTLFVIPIFNAAFHLKNLIGDLSRVFEYDQ